MFSNLYQVHPISHRFNRWFSKPPRSKSIRRVLKLEKLVLVFVRGGVLAPPLNEIAILVLMLQIHAQAVAVNELRLVRFGVRERESVSDVPEKIPVWQ